MRSFIVGTAGHIDHGKSALVLRPDRHRPRPPQGGEGAGDHHRPGLRPRGPGRRGRGLLRRRARPRALRAEHAGGRPRHRRGRPGRGRRRVGDAPDPRALRDLPAARGPARASWPSPSATWPTRRCQALAEMEVRELVAGSFLEGAPVMAGLRPHRRGARRLEARAPGAGPRGARRVPSAGSLRLPVDRVFTLARLRHRGHRHRSCRAPLARGRRAGGAAVGEADAASGAFRSTAAPSNASRPAAAPR